MNRVVKAADGKSLSHCPGGEKYHLRSHSPASHSKQNFLQDLKKVAIQPQIKTVGINNFTASLCIIFHVL